MFAHSVVGGDAGNRFCGLLFDFFDADVQHVLFYHFLHLRAVAVHDLGAHQGHEVHHVAFEVCHALEEVVGFASEDVFDVHLFDFVGALDAHLAFLLCHRLEVVEGRFFDEDFFVAEEHLPVGELVGGVLEDEVFGVVFEVLFCFALHEVVPPVAVLLNLEKFADELFEGTAVDVTQFANKD